MYEMALPLILPFFMQELALSYIRIGLFISVFAIFRSVLEFPLGHLEDKFGCKLIIVISMIIYSIGIISISLSHFYWQLLVSAAIAGVGASAYHPGGTALAARSLPNERGKALGITIGSGAVGSSIGPLIFGFFGSVLDWRGALAILTIPGFAIIILFWVFTVEPRDAETGIKYSDKNNLSSFLKCFSLPLILALAVSILRGVSQQGFSIFFPTYLTNIRFFTASSTAYHFTAILAPGAIGVALGGIISDKIGRKKVLITSAVLSSLLIPTFLIVEDKFVLILAIALGFSFSLSAGPVNALIADLSPQGVLSKMFALNFSVHAILGSIVTPLVFGWLADSAGLWMIFPLTSAVAVIMVPLLLSIRREKL